MELSENLGLKIVDLSDEADIEVQSENFKTLDKKIGEIIENTQEATEEKSGVITLKQLNEVGIKPQGELPKPSGNIYTYGEMLAIPDGQYNINTQIVFSYLGLGSTFMNTGVLFKKTYTVNGTKRVNLNYVNSAMDTGITGMSMFFIDISSENNKNLHTSRAPANKTRKSPVKE